MKKITSKKEAKKFIETITTQKGELKSKTVDGINDVRVYNEGIGEYRTHEKIGSGRFSKQQEKKSCVELTYILRKLNVKYTYENDAIRGGLLGEYILISDKRFLELIKSENVLEEIKDYLNINE